LIIPNLKPEEFKEQADQVKATNDALINSFSSLGGQIANSLNIGNDAMKGFVQTIISNAPKVIQAIMAQAAANKAAASANQVSNLKDATGNVIVSATSAAKGLGPIGLAALPILIGAGLAIISGAFKGGGKGSQSGGASQTFTNTPGREFGGSVLAGRPYIVGEKRPELFVPSSNGIIMPRIPTMGSNGMGNNGAGTNRVIVQVEGVIANDVIRIQNKRSIEKASRT
jgi:hypothetical protein